ncbi:MAG TPA: lantibiotic dehydratase, partial [Ktedonobacteraceae bacterium]|nr:lantibiotic dehydratase [Ktedonobacteraceae bacterium]
MEETIQELSHSQEASSVSFSAGLTGNFPDDSPVSFSAHWVALSNDEWALWNTVCVRGAGFPVDQALQLAMPAGALAADQLLFAEREREEAVAALRERLRRIAESYDKHGDVQEREKLDAQQAVLSAALRALKQGKLPQSTEDPGLDCPEVTQLRAACVRLAEAQEHFQRVFADATLTVSRAIHQVARSERFREAILWQNRLALHNGVDELLRYKPEETSQQSKLRTKEALVANYLLRYATKNDTIGFFGPVGCGQLVSAGETMCVRPGSTLLASRNVYFENWGIDTLAAEMAKDRRLWPWFVPRPMPHLYLDGRKLCLPFAKPAFLPEKQALILQACDGIRTAKEIAGGLLADWPGLFANEQEVYILL